MKKEKIIEMIKERKNSIKNIEEKEKKKETKNEQ